MKGLKKSKEKVIETEIDQTETLIQDLLSKRDEIYRTVQDFSVDAVTTDNAMHGMANINSEIKRAKTKLKKLQDESIRKGD